MSKGQNTQVEAVAYCLLLFSSFSNEQLRLTETFSPALFSRKKKKKKKTPQLQLVLRRLLRGRGLQGHLPPQDLGRGKACRDLGLQRCRPALEGEFLFFFSLFATKMTTTRADFLFSRAFLAPLLLLLLLLLCCLLMLSYASQLKLTKWRKSSHWRISN